MDYGPPGPIRCCSDVREAGDGISPNVTMSCESVCSDSVASCTGGSKVNLCQGLDGDGRCRGGAIGGTAPHLDEPASSVPPSKASQVDVKPAPPPSDCDSDTQEADVTSDLWEVSSDDDAFITEPPPRGELSLPADAALSRNTFECGRRQSAPGQLVQDDPGSESELQSRRPGIVEYFSR